MNSLIFEQVTSALTVKSILSPMGPDIPEGTTLDDLEHASDEGLDPFNHPSRVVDSDNDTVGLVWFEDYANAANHFDMEADDEDGPRLIDEVMQHLEPNRLLSSATTILDAVELFATKNSRYFYVIHVNKIVGVLFYSDLFKPIGRIAFLSLALEIEDLALRLCQSPKLSEKCWLSISDDRKRMSVELFTRRFHRKPCLKQEVWDQISNKELSDLTEVEKTGWIFATGQSDLARLIACTQLKDKATMIWKQKLIASSTRSEILGFFDELRDLRDSCAHPGDDQELLPKERLAHFVNSAQIMRKNLDEGLQSRG